MRTLPAVLLLAGVLLAACSLVPIDAADGGSCSDDDGCKSHRCVEGYCGGSNCEKDRGSCEDGWRCEYRKPDAVTGFFGADGTYACQALCGRCPGNSYCPEGGVAGETPCTFGKQPLTVEVARVEGKVGQRLRHTATVSPATTPKSVTWRFFDGVVQTTKTLETTYAYVPTDTLDGDVVVEVEDELGRKGEGRGRVTVSCLADGEACETSWCCANQRDGSACLPGSSETGLVCRRGDDG